MKNQTCKGKKRMALEAKAHATLKVKEHDMFAERQVHQCGWSSRKVRNGSGKRLDYRECWWPETMVHTYQAKDDTERMALLTSSYYFVKFCL